MDFIVTELIWFFRQFILPCLSLIPTFPHPSCYLGPLSCQFLFFISELVSFLPVLTPLSHGFICTIPCAVSFTLTLQQLLQNVPVYSCDAFIPLQSSDRRCSIIIGLLQYVVFTAPWKKHSESCCAFYVQYNTMKYSLLNTCCEGIAQTFTKYHLGLTVSNT